MVWPRRRIVLLVWAVVTVPMLCDQTVAMDSEGSDTDLPPDEAALFESTDGVKKAVIVKGDMDTLQLGEPVDSEDKPTGAKAPGRGQTLIIVADPRDRTITRLTPHPFLPTGYFQFLQYIIGNGVHKPTAVDYDRTGDFIYWTSVNGADSVVARSPYATGPGWQLDGELASEPEGIAVDPISRNLYWTDAGTDSIIVSRLDGSFRKSLITQGLDEPRAIVVDPNSGWMYWTDWGSPPRIERARMDGTQRSVIVNVVQGQWPNGLALDAVGQCSFCNIVLADFGFVESTKRIKRTMQDKIDRP
ncbi:low-density lipoprotein receptor-related protein 6-like [Branchiostoma floridae]|uniref:Low-density lipoprotein receptor-related protein 6-like n=2 Tax=Branchiostoma floridae TaxID=7739 RepID=A0A9J7KZC7_BRAFL|nr:low-density lipoprotein receptor-related protein 6-like [Branchiostoma floridae]